MKTNSKKSLAILLAILTSISFISNELAFATIVTPKTGVIEYAFL